MSEDNFCPDCGCDVFECMGAVTGGAPCNRSQDERIAFSLAQQKRNTSTAKSIPLSVAIIWSIACLSLGFAAAGLLLGCGPIVPTGSNNCCYGSADTSVQECAGFLDGCVFIATGEAGCGEMICD